MNLQHKKVRLPIAALGVTALIAGAGALTSPAHALGETLTFLGADSNAATIVAADPTLAATAPVTFGIKVGGASAADLRDLVLEVLTAPTGGEVFAQRAAANAAPAANAAGSQAVGAGPTLVTGSNVAGASTITTNIASSADLTGHTIKIGTDLATVVSGGLTTTLVMDRPIVAVHAVVAVMDLGATSVAAFLPTAAATTDEIFSYDASTADNVYFGATDAGTYTLRLFKDTGGDGAYQANADDTTPTFTLTVKSAADSFTLAVPSSVEAGTNGPKATVTSTLSTTDIRGGSPATLATNVAALLGFDIEDLGVGGPAGVTGENSDGAATYDSTNGFYRYLSTAVGTALTQGVDSPHSLSTALAFNGGSALSTKTTTVTSATVTTLDLEVGADQTANVVGTGPVYIRPGTASVTYTATAEDVSGDPVSGKSITFTLGAGSGTALTDLKGNGVAVPVSGEVTATTNSSGVATLIVTSTKTLDGNAYTVDAMGGGADATLIAASYADAVADDVVVTNTAAELTPTVAEGVSVTLKGKLTDQFGSLFTPAAASANQTVEVKVPTGGTTICNAQITAGAFSCVYTPATLPTAGTQTSFTFTYPGGITVSSNINWASSVAAATVTLTTPAAGATAVDLQDTTTPVATQTNGGSVPFGNTTGEVTGTVLDADGAGLAYKTVTLTGTSGVYFSTKPNTGGNPMTTATDDDLVSTITVVTNGSGVFNGAYAFFTKSGSADVIATVGAVAKTASVTTMSPWESYKVSVNDAAGAPGSTLIITGKATDMFGNGVVGSPGTALSIGTSTLGAFGDSSPDGNADGVFSTSFVTGSNQDGVADLVATIPGATTNPLPHASWLTLAGMTIGHGEYMDHATITITTTKLTLGVTAKLFGGGTSHISGSFLPNTGVDIWAKASGAASYSLLNSVETNAAGNYSTSHFTKRGIRFLAKSAGLSSPVRTTYVYSTVKLTGKSYSHNRATLWANGAPSAKGTITFYRAVPGADPVLATMTSNSYGNGSRTVKLPKGNRYVYVKFTAPGTYMGRTSPMKIVVK